MVSSGAGWMDVVNSGRSEEARLIYRRNNKEVLSTSLLQNISSGTMTEKKDQTFDLCRPG